MENKIEDKSHFEAERRDRFVITAFIIVALQVLASFGLLDRGAALCVLGLNCIQLVANYFSTPKVDLFRHFSNIGTGFTPFVILAVSPTELALARLISLVNATIIGFEQRKLFFRVFYTVICMIPWYFVSKFIDYFNFDTCSRRRFEQEAGVFMLSILIVLLISCSHSFLERKALKETEEAVAELKIINSKYENANKELKRLLEEKDNFILLFSHETRNPLNILMGNLAILLNEVQVPRIRARIVRAKFCSEILLHNLNNILDTGKLLNRGNLETAPVTVNVSEYLHSIWDIVKMMVMKKQLKPMFVIPQSLPSFAKFDSQKVSQLIINLVSNSVKFTSSGSVGLIAHYLNKNEINDEDFLPSSVFGSKLIWKKQSDGQRTLNENLLPIHGDEMVSSQGISNVCYRQELMREFKSNSQGSNPSSSTSLSPEGKGFLKIEIIDTGSGITEEGVSGLFQKFSQFSSDPSQRQLGSGLGLWISKTLSELLGGGIRAYSKQNVGTALVFIIRVDCTIVETKSKYDSQILSWIDKEPPTQRVLLVDDDPYNIETHFQLLKSLGLTQVDTAADGLALVNIFKSKPEGYYDFIISDINMPHLDGVEAVKQIRQFEKSEKRSSQAKIGFITGHSNSKEKQVCEGTEVGASFYLSKPVTLSTLQGALQTLGFKPNNRHRLQSPRGTAVSEKALTERKSKGKPVVLCVDDDILNLEIFEDLISDLGAKSLRATSGREGVEIFRSAVTNGQKIDLVLIDCLMSGVDGWTACAEMKKILDKVPIIGVTGDDIKRHEEKFRVSGMNKMIRKPVQREELQKLLKHHAGWAFD